MTATNSNTKYMALCGLFAALTAICSWISIPLGFTPVPMNLATLAVFLAGGLLGPKYGPLSLTVYALAGAVGIPVFAGFRGGFSVLAGPTGGYVIGYIVAAFVVGLLCHFVFNSSINQKRDPKDSDVSHDNQQSRARHGFLILQIIGTLVISLATCYILGTLWFVVSTGTNVAAALFSCVIPFLPGDAIKIVAATILLPKLHKYV